MRENKIIYQGIVFCLLLSGCTGSSIVTLGSSTTTTTDASASASPSTTPTGARAIKIIFQQASPGGSFDAPASAGTVAAAGSGLKAVRIFNADGSALASGSSSNSNWPGWLSSFEIGVSGTANTSSGNTYCANFAGVGEDTVDNCKIGPSGSLVAAKCGAPQGLFRVSEADCSLGSPTTTDGNGGPSDGVYFRAVFNRSSQYIASHENLLVVIEYAAAALNPAPANPTQCFSGGKFTPESCSDFVWKAYIKHSASEIVQPFLLLVPPTFSAILAPGTTGPQNAGTGVASRQFFIPLAGDKNLTVLQISRVHSNFPGVPTTAGTAAYNLMTYCTPGTLPAKTPFCAGMLFYSITFYRI